ncbi:MAG: DUF1318 domain-containing protein [Gammaproteobacteria bacterium]
MTRLRSLAPLPLFVLLVSCVTINIYFPAAEAEEAARTIVRDVLGKESNDEQPPPEQPAPSSGNVIDNLKVRFAETVITLFIPRAHAQANININTPKIDQLRGSLKSRSGAMRAFYQSGAIGLGADGMVKARDLAKAPLNERNTVKKLLADDNRDRAALYKEIAIANGHPEWEKDIRDTFARVWVQEAPAGTSYQDAQGNWKQK